MEKYQETHYLLAHIEDKIYPWIKESLIDHQALNGKHISDRDTPIVSFVGDLMVIFVIKRGENAYEIVKDNMLPPGTDIERLYHKACENLVRDVEFVISQTLFGGFGIVADGIHEASALCFKHIWTLCTDKLNEDVVIMAPAKDMVLFVPRSNKIALEQMIQFGTEAFNRNQDKISKSLLLFSKERGELLRYEESH